MEYGTKFATDSDGMNRMAYTLDTHGGLDRLEKLQEYPNKEVYALITKLIVDFFGIEDEDVKEIKTMS